MLSLQRSLTGLTEPLVVPGRSLLKRGTLLKACRKNIQPREFFLFSDCLVYASPVSGGMESASAAWQALARGGLYGNTTELASPTSATSPSVPSDTDSSEMPILAFSQRIRTSSGPTMDQQALTGAAFHLEGQQLQFRGKFPLQDCTVVGVEDSEGLRHSFEIRTPEKSFAVYAETSQGREGWLSAVREARAELMSARRTLRTDEDTIEAKRNRRRSQYQESKSNLRGVSGMSRRTGMSTAPSNGTIAESDSQDGTGPVRSESREIMRPSSSAPTSVSLATLLAPSVNSATPPKALRVLEDYNAPVWVPDSRADRCICCAEGFGIWRRKHHCRLCGQVVCWACSTRVSERARKKSRRLMMQLADLISSVSSRIVGIPDRKLRRRARRPASTSMRQLLRLGLPFRVSATLARSFGSAR